MENLRIKPLKLRKLKPIIYNPVILHKLDRFIDIYRIELNEKYTRIDFVTEPDIKRYVSGWWVNIHNTIYIKPADSYVKLPLVSVVNIPVAPAKYYFKNSKDIKAFTLYFPPLSKRTKSIDIIENESSGSAWFNFYGIKLNTINKFIFAKISIFGNN